MTEANNWLIAGGLLSISAAILHLIIIFKGASWYRFFGAGERMATLSEQGSWIPGVITFGIAVVLFIWGLYAFSGAGLILQLPYIKVALIVISTIYLTRGLVLLPALVIRPDLVDGFAVWSSVISFVLGICYALGTWQQWSNMS